MNEKLKLLIYLLIAALVISGAYIAYRVLAPKAPAGGIVENEPPGNDTLPSYDFTVEDTSGNEVKLSDKRGKPKVLNFWATWCPYCTAEMPDFQKAYEKYGDRVEFMMINATDGTRETKDMAINYINYGGFTFPVYYDVNLSASITFGANSLPSTFFLDENGNIVAYINSMISAERLEEGIGMILK